MGAKSVLTIDDLEFARLDELDYSVITLFSPTDKYAHVEDDSWKQYVAGESDSFDGAGIFGYASTVGIVKQRLELQGFTKTVAEEAFEIGRQRKVQTYHAWSSGQHSANFQEHRERCAEIVSAKSFTPECWVSALRAIRHRADSNRRSTHVDSVDDLESYMRFESWNQFGFPGDGDVRCSIRLALEAFKDDNPIFYDLDAIVSREVYASHTDLFSHADYLCFRDGEDSLRIIVLTEGSSDKWILQRSIQVLTPHLDEYFTFMDFEGARIEGGAGALASIVKAFAGAGIQNKILALFDNDTAGRSALRKLELLKLPGNISVLPYPPLQTATEYPTQGPTGDVVMDVNGLACSLELYLGLDVLRDQTGCLLPVRWRGYDESMRSYQGEVTNKKQIQEAFERKLNACEVDPSLVEQFDWSGVLAIISAMCNACSMMNARWRLEFEREQATYDS